MVATEHKQEHLQTEGDTLQVIEEIVMRNASNPPRTLMNDRPFEIQLPPEAEVIAGKVQIGGAQPITRKSAPGGQKGQYYFLFPSCVPATPVSGSPTGCLTGARW